MNSIKKDNKIIFPPSFFQDVWGLEGVKIIKVLKDVRGKYYKLTGIIDSTTGKYIFKIFGSWRNVGGVNKDTKVFEILQNKGFKNISKLLKTKDQKNFKKVGKNFIYLVEYIEGKNPKPTQRAYEKLAVVTAKLHSVKNFPFKTDFDTVKIAKDLRKNSAKFKFGSQYREIVKSLPNFNKFPHTVIHTDIAPSNSVQKKDGTIVFVDWDDVGLGPTIIDLGSVLNEIIKEDTSFSKNNVRTLYQIYFKHRKISETEKAHIFDGCLFFALMYISHGNLSKRWKRILWLIENRKSIESLYLQK